MSQEDIREAFLYIGLDLKSITPENYPAFRGIGKIPIAWFFLFDPKEIKSRQEVMPESLGLFQGEFENDPNYESKFENFVNEPVAFETTIPHAQARLQKYKEVFKQIPYFWSYFRVIEILEEYLEEHINILTERSIEDAKPVIPAFHPEVPLSQVKVKSEKEEDEDIELDAFSALSNFGFDSLGPVDKDKEEIEGDDLDDDNPFADLMNFGQDTQTPSKPAEDPSMLDADLMDQLFLATTLDSDEEEEKEEETFEEEEDFENYQSTLVITAKFDHLAIEGYGENIHNIFQRINNLYHHITREGGKLTRIMIDIFQDIFRESTSPWRITGLLSEDFVQADPSNLGNIMIGDPSAFTSKTKISFDLEFWSKNTLQESDERLMFTLSKLPSEDLHGLLEDGDYIQLSEIVVNTLKMTKARKEMRYTKHQLSKTPNESNIWGIRVLIPHEKTYRAATLLSRTNDKSWEEDFLERLDLPGVLTDWNIEYNVRYSEFSDAGTYKIVFRRAEGKDDTFRGFLRWIRRHHSIYVRKYGISGTIIAIKNRIIETEDPTEGQSLFTVLTNLSQVGFDDAVTALTDERLVNKLGWIYSTM